jgi:hypothetical protein
MKHKVILLWNYKPTTFFEEAFSTVFDGVQIAIDGGRIRALTDNVRFDKERELVQGVQYYIEDLFSGVMLQSHENYEISGLQIQQESDKGVFDITVIPGTGEIVIVSDKVDVKVTDKDGNIIIDTRQQMIVEKQKFALMIAELQRKDINLSKMLDSYSNSVRDPSNEFVHLYEIRDIAARIFGSEQDAIKSLGISNRNWRRFGKLANSEPIKVGRHRGSMKGSLRDATNEELDYVRSIVQKIIVNYIKTIQ